MEEGSDAIFRCAANGYPRPEVSWLKNDSLLPNHTLTQNGSISYLVIQSVTKRQNYGMYKCVAVNLVGREFSKAGRLKVSSKAAEIPTTDTFQRVGKNCLRYTDLQQKIYRQTP